MTTCRWCWCAWKRCRPERPGDRSNKKVPGVLPLDSLLARWRGEAVSSLLPGAKADDIRAAFEQAHSHATADIVRLYERIGGMEISDNDWWLLWSLPEIVDRKSVV